MSVSNLSAVPAAPQRPDPAPAAITAPLASEAGALRDTLMRAMVFAVFAAAGLGMLWFGCAMVMAGAVTVAQSLAFTLPGAALLLAGAGVATLGGAGQAAPAFGPTRR
jgi:hypothetical protein